MAEGENKKAEIRRVVEAEQAHYRSLGAMIAAGAVGGAVSGVANAAAQQTFAKLGSIRKPKDDPKK